MISTKDTVRRVLDKLPEDCSMDEFLDQLFYINLIEKRLDESEDPKAPSFSTDEVRGMIAQWRVK